MASSPLKSATSSPSRRKSRSKSTHTSKRKSTASSPDRPQNALPAHGADQQGQWRQEAAPLEPEAGASDVPATLSAETERGASSPMVDPGGALGPSVSAAKPTDSKERLSTALHSSASGTLAHTSWGPSPGRSAAVSRKSSTARQLPSPRNTLAEEIQAIAELRELAEKGSLSVETPYRSKEGNSPRTNRCTVIAAVAVAFVTVSACILVLRLLLRSTGDRTRDPAVCSSAACEVHRIIIGVDRHPPGLNPCDDFGRFVCSGWNNTQPLLARAVKGEKTNSWLFRLSMPGTYADPKYTVLRRVARMAADCKDETRGHDAEAVASLVGFMTREFFPWLLDESDPTIGELDYYPPLQTLFQLAVRWSLPLWFDVNFSIHPFKWKTNRNRSVLVKPSPMGIMWKRIHDIVLSYKDFYMTYVDMFQRNVYSPNNVTSRRYLSFLANSSTLQGHIFGNLTKAYLTGDTAPVIVDDGDLPSFGRSISADQWINLLQSSFNFQPPVTKINLIFATNDAIITAVTELLKGYSARDVTFHTAWWLTQILGAHTSKEISREINLDKKGSLSFAMSCGLLLSESYHILIASINLSGLNAREQALVSTVLENVYSASIYGLQSSKRIDNRTRKILREMLEETTTTIWPYEPLRSDESLLRLYGSEYNTTLGFFGHWLTSRVQLQRSMGSPEYAVGGILYKLELRYMTTYNPLAQVIAIAEAALAPPFFYPRSTSAIIYGGLGFLYAEALVRSLHTMAAYGSKREPLNRNMSFWHLLLCPDETDPRTVFPELPALVVAHAAYRKARTDAEDLPLKGMEHYSAEQVFFLTACHGKCELGADGQPQSESCNRMVRNFRPFSRAFSCPQGSPMNPERKCSYL